jgi:BirA family biotin operon repressor/biotin-[acetyl-CoA-carboxylase] ligase
LGKDAIIPSPAELLPFVIRAYEGWIQQWQNNGFGPLRDAWLSHAYGLGEQVTTSDNRRGIFQDMGQSGSLLLRNASGQAIEISAGEVFFSSQEES